MADTNLTPRLRKTIKELNSAIVYVDAVGMCVIPRRVLRAATALLEDSLDKELKKNE